MTYILLIIICHDKLNNSFLQEVDSTPNVPVTAEDFTIKDKSLSPFRSKNRKIQENIEVVHTRTNVIDDADLNWPTDYFMIQCLGKESYDIDNKEEEEGIEESDYQTKLGWNEVLLDDFS